MVAAHYWYISANRCSSLAFRPSEAGSVLSDHWSRPNDPMNSTCDPQLCASSISEECIDIRQSGLMLEKTKELGEGLPWRRGDQMYDMDQGSGISGIKGPHTD